MWIPVFGGLSVYQEPAASGRNAFWSAFAEPKLFVSSFQVVGSGCVVADDYFIIGHCVMRNNIQQLDSGLPGFRQAIRGVMGGAVDRMYTIRA